MPDNILYNMGISMKTVRATDFDILCHGVIMFCIFLFTHTVYTGKIELVVMG